MTRFAQVTIGLLSVFALLIHPAAIAQPSQPYVMIGYVTGDGWTKAQI